MINQPPSALQEQFPLSPKKFWKKIMSSLIGCTLIGLMTIVFFFVFASIMEGAVSSSVIAIVFLVLLGYLLLRAWYIKTYIRRYFYSASDDFITIKKGVFAPAEIHVQYPKIQDVYVDQDILDRIMGLYDVHIASATVSSGIEAHIDGVEEAAAEGLKNLFLDRIRGGGRAGSSQASTTSTSQVMADVSKPIDASQMISSAQYPIASKWLLMQIIGALIHAAWLSFLIMIYVGGLNMVIGFTAFVLILIFQIIYNSVWKNNFRFAFLPDYLLLSTQFLSKSEQHMPYRTIQDVIVKQGIIERMFGLATVSIQNAAANQSQSTVSSWGGGIGASQAVNIPGQALGDANKIAEIIRSISIARNSATTGL